MSQSIKVNKYYNARSVLLDQLAARGFDVSNYKDFGINEVNIMLQNSTLDMVFEKEHKVYVRYFQGKMFKPKDIREIIDEDIVTNEDTIIFVTPEDGNDTIREYIKQLWEEENIFIILLSVKKLQYNVLEHILVPRHEIISKEEVEDVMKKFKMTNISLFPEISRFDAVATAIGMRPGEVCKIYRPSKTSIITHYYRLCINK
uniref:RNA polymerase subunit H/Rpb5 C-terminal domain-containing protein n=1 Tax=viral metagenome TaxID=1070528 RepID=A0A6C0HTB5_9ZZZZ